MKEAKHERLHFVQLHFYEMLEKAKLPIVERVSVLPGVRHETSSSKIKGLKETF